MPSTYTTGLRLTKQAVGENINGWGTIWNAAGGSDLIDFALTGITEVALAATNVTLTTANGSDDEARAAILNCSGVLSANVAIIIPNVRKTYIVRNGTSGSFTLTIRTAAGTGPEVVQSASLAIWCDGNDNTYSVGATVDAEVNSLIDAKIATHNADPLAHLQASTTQRGTVELATDAETQTGTDTERAITPSALSARTATTDRTGVVELATNAETVTGADTSRATTPAGVAAAIAAAGGLSSGTFNASSSSTAFSFTIPGGVLVQGGITSAYTSTLVDDDIVFATAFSEAPMVFVSVAEQAANSPIVYSSSRATSGFHFQMVDRNSGVSFTARVAWLAIGTA